jgi:hypothetical protein
VPALFFGNIGFNLVGELLRVALDWTIVGLEVHAEYECTLTNEGLENSASEALG